MMSLATMMFAHLPLMFAKQELTIVELGQLHQLHLKLVILFPMVVIIILLKKLETQQLPFHRLILLEQSMMAQVELVLTGNTQKILSSTEVLV